MCCDTVHNVKILQYIPCEICKGYLRPGGGWLTSEVPYSGIHSPEVLVSISKSVIESSPLERVKMYALQSILQGVLISLKDIRNHFSLKKWQWGLRYMDWQEILDRYFLPFPYQDIR